MAIRLVLADDHPVVLAGLAEIFRAEGDFDVVACVRDGAHALAALREHEPDILVLDLRMPVKDGLAVLREMQHEAFATPVVVLTAAEGEDVFEAIRLGVRGVVLKDMAASLLVDAVRCVHTGGTWIERSAAGAAIGRLTGHATGKPNALFQTLTSREAEVAKMAAQGLSSKAIADRLAITEGTAKLHLHHVYEKLGVHGRVALVHFMRSSEAA